jgi:hypothetical protein
MEFLKQNGETGGLDEPLAGLHPGHNPPEKPV